MRKSLLRYFWSHFKSLKTEKQMAFAFKNGEWSAYHISKNETDISGELDIERIASIAHHLQGADVYIIHNHPSQTPEPSNPDHFQYGYVRAILALCRVEVHDYMIVSPYGYFSFREAGLLKEEKPFSFQETPAVSIETPPFSQRVDLIQNKQMILSLSEKYGEFITNNRIQYGTKESFEGTFLLKKERLLGGKNIFFKRLSNKDDFTRLEFIDRVMDPIDIYAIKDDLIVSLKTSVRV